jgi:hypothetical protein
VIFGSIAWAWLTEDVLHLGLLDWFEQMFGRQNGAFAWYFFWIFTFGTLVLVS